MRQRFHKATSWLPTPLRKLIVFVAGSVVLFIGILMIVLPGPAFIVIPLGLAILSLEFLWAHSLLTKAKAMFHNAAVKAGVLKPKDADDTTNINPKQD